MKLKVTKNLVDLILKWIEEGATKDSKGNKDVPSILERLKQYTKETHNAVFKQNHMPALFSLDISSISDYKTLDEAYQEKQRVEIEGIELAFDEELAAWHEAQLQKDETPSLEDEWSDELQDRADADLRAHEDYLLS